MDPPREEKKPVVEPAPSDDHCDDLTGQALRLRIRQQELLAELGVLALQGTSFMDMLNHTARITAWEYEKGARATDLIKILKGNGLFPDFADQSFDQLIATLKSGLPVVRNRTGGHGQGAQPVEVPEYVAVYALNLAASKIRLLYEAFKASER